MNDEQVRKIVREELYRNPDFSALIKHDHNGNNSLKIRSRDIIQSPRINSGSISFTQVTQYRIGINFNPSQVWFYGNVVSGDSPTTVKASFIGNALLGDSYYLAPSTSTSVTVSKQLQGSGSATDSRYYPAQSSSYFSVDTSAATAYHTLLGQTHILDVQYPVGTVHARGTIIGYTDTYLIFNVDNLDAGWTINGNFIIT